MSKYGHVIAAVQGRPWALLPEKLDVIVEVLNLRSQGISFTPEELQARIGSSRPVGLKETSIEAASQDRRPYTVVGAVAVLPLYGVIAQRMNMMVMLSGGTSTQLFGAALREALADESVSAVVIDVDSPGGEVFGVQELAEAIYAARAQKPVYAIANSFAASAAIWLATQAGEFSIAPGGMAGSIGVYMLHVDQSAANEMQGFKPTYISAGKYKVEGNPDEPLGDEAAAHMQETVDEYYDAFTSAVARGRGVSAEMVRTGFGEGRMLTASAAVRAGLVDRIETLDQLLARIRTAAAVPQGAATSRRAEHAGTAINAVESRERMERAWDIALAR